MEEEDLSEIGLYKYPLSIKDLCYEDPRGFIIDTHRNKRCKIEYLFQKIIGGYGILYFALRNDEKVLIKGPRFEEDSIINESILQYKSYKVLEKYKLQFVIPKVYDIFSKGNSIYLCMEYLETISFDTFLLQSKNLEKDILYSLLQVCIILNVLENKLYLNHRDLRITNILVSEKPSEYIFYYNNKKYKMKSEFHICIIDFGFACVGKDKTQINGNETLFSNNVKCLKHGRDIFQLLVSIWSIKDIRDKVSVRFRDTILSLLNHEENKYRHLAKWNEYLHMQESKWTFSFTSYEDFSMKHLKPKHLIQTILDLLNLIEET